MTFLQDMANSDNLSPSSFLEPQPCSPWSPSYPSLELPTWSFQSPKRMRVSELGIWRLLDGARHRSCSFRHRWGQPGKHRQTGCYRCVWRWLAAGECCILRCEPHQLRSPPSVQPVGCLHHPPPLVACPEKLVTWEWHHLKLLPSHCLPWASCQIRKIAGAHAPGMPGTFSPPLRVSDPDMHHGTCVMHVPWCMLGSLNSSFRWSWRQGNTFPAFLAHAQPTIVGIW